MTLFVCAKAIHSSMISWQLALDSVCQTFHSFVTLCAAVRQHCLHAQCSVCRLHSGPSRSCNISPLSTQLDACLGPFCGVRLRSSHPTGCLARHVQAPSDQPGRFEIGCGIVIGVIKTNSLGTGCNLTMSSDSSHTCSSVWSCTYICVHTGLHV